MTQPSAWDDYDPAADTTTSTWGRSRTDAYEGIKPTDSRIDETADGHAFASVIGKGWHNFGTVFDSPQSAETLLNTANADYDVFTRPMFADLGGSMIPVPGKVVICGSYPTSADTTPFGTGSDNYTPVSNREAFLDFGDQLVQATEPLAATCGVLYGGRRAFMCWRLPRNLMIGGRDAHELWLTVLHSHDQSWPLTVMCGTVRTACANTCRYNLRTAVNKWTVRKTANVAVRLQEVHEAMQMTMAYTDEYERVANGLVNVPMSDSTFEKIITANFGPGEDPSKKATTRWEIKRGVLMQTFRFADNLAPVRGTSYAALQAVGEFADHMMGVRTTKDTATFTTPEAYKFWRAWDNNPEIMRPKERMMASVRAYAGV